MTEVRAQVGYLFVHGIGEQAQGSMLTEWSDRFVRFLEGMLGADSVTVTSATLTSPSDGTPAHLEIDIVFPGRREPVRWQLAEGWWAHVFGAPSFRDLAAWAFFTLPFTILAHFVSNFRRAWRSTRSVIVRAALVTGNFLLITLAVALLPVFSILVGVILILGLIPIQSVRRLAGVIQRSLSQTLGDSFVFLGSPSRAGAIVHQVERDMHWLSMHSDHMVVVAHSQGAEVAHRAARRLRPPGLKRFVTLGSGQTKLRTIERAIRTQDRWGIWWAPAGVAVIIASLVLARDQLVREGLDEAWAALVWAFVGLGFLGIGISSAGGLDPPADSEADPYAADGWLDLYASHDPVANGPVYGLETPTSIVCSQMVRNRNSYWRDHSSYSRNMEQIVAPLVMLGADACGSSLEIPGEPQRLGPGTSGRRSWRVWWLRICRWFATIVGLILLAALWDHLGSLATPVTSAAVVAFDAIPGLDLFEAAPDSPEAKTVSGALVLGIASWIGYRILAGLWAWWDAADARRTYQRPQPYSAEVYRFPLWTPEFVAILESMAGMSLVALLAGARVDVAVRSLTLSDIASLVLLPLLLVTGLLFLGRVLSVPAIWLESRGIVDPGRARTTTAQQLALLVPYGVIVFAYSVLELPGPSSPWLATALIFGPIFVLYLGAPLLTSSDAVGSLLRPLRRLACAPDHPPPSEQFVSAQWLIWGLREKILPELEIAAGSDMATQNAARASALLKLRAMSGAPLPKSVRRQVKALLEEKQEDSAADTREDATDDLITPLQTKLRELDVTLLDAIRQLAPRSDSATHGRTRER